jgi:quercetin dioxygenase-like cupin family protein
MKIKLLQRGLNVMPIYWALQQRPELWDQHTTRTRDAESPHHGLSDIWARFGPEEAAETGQPHDSAWYPCADMLGVKQLAHDVMHFVHGVRLGGVLITRIPAGRRCKPHTDPGWHARYYDKFAVQIASAPGQSFCFEGEALETQPGDLFWFDNQHLHWVENPTPYERITLICCIRKED